MPAAGSRLAMLGALRRAVTVGTVSCMTACSNGPSTPSTPPAPVAPSVLSMSVVSDDFERADLGTNWTVYSGAVGIVDNRAIGVRSAGGTLLGLGLVAWTATMFGTDQFSEAVLSPNIDAQAQFQVFVRRRVSDRQRYGFHWNLSASRWELKRDGGPAAPVLATASGTPLAAGDVLRIEARGTTLRGFRNGTLVLTAEDSVLAGQGEPGMALNVRFVTRFPAPFAERWNGGSLD